MRMPTFDQRHPWLKYIQLYQLKPIQIPYTSNGEER